MVAAVTPALAQNVDYTFERGTDFLKYKTFTVRDGTSAYHVEAEKLIMDAVERELTLNGLTRDDEYFDLIAYTYALSDRQTLDALADPDYWEFITGGNSQSAWAFGAGTIVVDLVDPATDVVVWRAAAAGTVKGSFDRMAKRTEKAIGKMFRNYPPPL
jgi:hypothetical protein